jgi:hypothetical protein
MVLEQFVDQERFFDLKKVQEAMRRTNGFESFDVKKFMVILLLLHDIGKSIGADASEQHAFTLPIMGTIMSQLGFSRKEVALAKLMVGNDILGEFEKNDGRVSPASVTEVIAQIRALADEAGVPARQFFRMLRALYISDASSYPFIRDNFMERRKSGQLKFKIRPEEDVGRTDSLIDHFEKM